MNKEFTVSIRYTFEGSFKIIAENRSTAIELATQHCGMTTSKGIHTSLPDETVPDWNFPVHPNKKFISCKQKIDK